MRSFFWFLGSPLCRSCIKKVQPIISSVWYSIEIIDFIKPKSVLGICIIAFTKILKTMSP